MSKKTGETWGVLYRIRWVSGKFGPWWWKAKVFRSERAARREFKALSAIGEVEVRIVRGETIEERKKPKRKAK